MGQPASAISEPLNLSVTKATKTTLRKLVRESKVHRNRSSYVRALIHWMATVRGQIAAARPAPADLYVVGVDQEGVEVYRAPLSLEP